MHPGSEYVQPPPKMVAQPSDSNLPQALAYLAQLDQVLVKQKKEAIEIITGWERANKYVILNTMGQQILFAKEKSSTLQRQCCGPQRAFEMEIYDNNEQEVIHISRPYKCVCYHQACSCMKCCLDYVTVEAPPGRVVGRVRQIYGNCEARYEIMDANDQTTLLIHGPNYCKCYCPGDDIPFNVLTADGSQEVGKVSRTWSNLLQEMFTDADNFGIAFPVDLHVDVKATVIGACFLIDFMFFEKNQN